MKLEEHTLVVDILVSQSINRYYALARFPEIHHDYRCISHSVKKEVLCTSQLVNKQVLFTSQVTRNTS